MDIFKTTDPAQSAKQRPIPKRARHESKSRPTVCSSILLTRQLTKSADKQTLGRLAAVSASRVIRAAISTKGFAVIIVATGASQFEMLKHLVPDRAIDWSVVTMFHLDEYIGLPSTHPASFQRYLRERFLAHPPPLQAFSLHLWRRRSCRRIQPPQCTHRAHAR